MPTMLAATIEDARAHAAAVTQCLREGFPICSPNGNRYSRSATRAAAERLGINRQTLIERIGTPEAPGSYFDHYGIQPDWEAGEKAKAERGELGFAPVLPGFAIKRTTREIGPDGETNREFITQTKAPGAAFALKPGHVIAGVSALLDAEGRTTSQWVKTKAGHSVEDTLDELRAALSCLTEYKVDAAPAPQVSDNDLATVYICADWHIGLLSWKKESGKDWDLRIAQDTIRASVRRLVSASPPSKQAVILGLGDLLHADDFDNRTPKSGHALDVDGRHPKILRAAAELLIATIDAALRKHEQVLVRILPGNHDPKSAVGIALALSLRYEDDPRVTVDDDQAYFWWWSWGTTMLGATHGDGAKMADLPLIMASWNPEAWGRSIYRHIYTGHIHTKTGIELSGVTVESFQTPVVPDSWHTRMGYRANRSMTSITIHRTDGEVARNKVNVV